MSDQSLLLRFEHENKDDENTQNNFFFHQGSNFIGWTAGAQAGTSEEVRAGGP